MVAKVINTEASTVEDVIMNMMIICNLAACWTEAPPRIVPVIVPGIAMIPMTLLGGKSSEILARKRGSPTKLTSC